MYSFYLSLKTLMDANRRSIGGIINEETEPIGGCYGDDGIEHGTNDTKQQNSQGWQKAEQHEQLTWSAFLVVYGRRICSSSPLDLEKNVWVSHVESRFDRYSRREETDLQLSLWSWRVEHTVVTWQNEGTNETCEFKCNEMVRHLNDGTQRQQYVHYYFVTM